MSKKDEGLSRLKTGGFSRRLELSKLGLKFGSRAIGQKLREQFSDNDEAHQQRRQQNIDWLIAELGKLKGSVVKIGQVMATYGDFVLPPEVADALHRLEDDTPPMAWSVIQKQLHCELGAERLAELDIDPTPLAAASLGQVHRATLKKTGAELCIKVQYPGVDTTIDADFGAVLTLLKLSRLLESTRNIDAWFEDVRELLHKEVDYEQERRDMDFVAQKLAADSRYIVPQSYPEYCTRRILTMSYEASEAVASDAVQALSQSRRNALGRSILGVFLNEVFCWKRLQTDPNFGNFRVRVDPQGEQDQLLLLDFGAMRMLSEPFATEFGEMLLAAYRKDRIVFLERAISLEFMKSHFPDSVLQNFADIGMDIAEPLRGVDDSVPSSATNSDGVYHWRQSNLPKRIAKQAMAASLSLYFALPPKDFLYVMRKLLGVYALIAQLDAQFDGEPVLKAVCQLD
ncbi:AarF/ABC1/UbiB kinase family protein [Spongiibacter sp. KMU-158]|uniref:AarF/ABC1/UbiB kinase family protein n=1 Tax=Spongiibacter pelagi TaxID=2760804 RepID=A0A927BZA5_9GAMM|nr:AarF/ABC1/UbiB kinase family protein [Spongiibacter pelagi]MBD2857799.1 AarF/ABC1/UbiB kinase family protein [Spongiibacter pelagi]